MMRRLAAWAGWAAALVLVVAWVGACESGTDPSGTDGDDGTGTDTGTIVASVTADGSPTSGVTVELFAEGSATVLETRTTSGAGEAVFSQLASGTYEVEVTAPAGYRLPSGAPARQSVSVTDGQESTVSFSLETDESANVVEVTLTNYAFTPGDLTIEPGTTVRWVNETSTFHTITPDGHSEWAEGSVSQMGETFTHTFETEGTFPYYCSPHLSFGMTGSVTVEAP